MKNYFFILFVLLISHTGQAQERKEDVSKIIDDLTIKWDKEAVNLEQYR